MTFHRILIAPAILGALLIAGCGDSSHDSGSTASGAPVDRAFAEEMITHHQSAVEMAKIAQRRGSSAFVKQLADDIVRTQTEEIATMRAADQRLQEAGAKKGPLGVAEHMMGMDGDVSMLNGAKPFDRAFLKMMIPHHEGAIVMANAELKNGKDAELKTLARNIITAQRREITEMRKHLGDAGTGGTSDHAMDDAGHSG